MGHDIPIGHFFSNFESSPRGTLDSSLQVIGFVGGVAVLLSIEEEVVGAEPGAKLAKLMHEFMSVASMLVVSHDILITIVSDEGVLASAGDKDGMVFARVRLDGVAHDVVVLRLIVEIFMLMVVILVEVVVVVWCVVARMIIFSKDLVGSVDWSLDRL